MFDAIIVLLGAISAGIGAIAVYLLTNPEYKVQSYALAFVLAVISLWLFISAIRRFMKVK